MNRKIYFSAKRQLSKKPIPGKTASQIFKESIAQMENSCSGLSEEEIRAAIKKIQQKMKMGKSLTAQELNLLRVHDPETYRSAIRVERSRKNLKQRLKQCRSKEAVQNVITSQLSVLRAMRNDPDREYLAPMIQQEIQEFLKSSHYARLPETEKDEKRNKKNSSSQAMISLKAQSFQQCEMLSEQLKKLTV